MKTVLAIILIVLLVIVAVHPSSASFRNMKTRYYDILDSKNDRSSNGFDDIVRYSPFSRKGSKKEDPCANKPLWYLKYQARLGKLSPFYDCLSVHGL